MRPLVYKLCPALALTCAAAFAAAAPARGPAAALALRPHAPASRRMALRASPRARPEAVCGDSLLDNGESCDDGNLDNGDGCSASCQIEPGFECTDPLPPSGNVVADGSFEAGTPNPSWDEYSLQYGTPLCDPGSCFQNGASNGSWWAWFGGTDTFEEASLEQTVTIPTTGTNLLFDLFVGVCDSTADYLSVLIDGQELLHNACAVTPAYVTRSISVAAYADGNPHSLRFEAMTFGNNQGNSNLFVDRVILNSHTGSEPVPSHCTPLPPLCQAYDFGSVAGDLSGWTRFHTGALAVDWGTTDDGYCWSNTPDPPVLNVTGGSGPAACADSDAAGSGIVDAFLCSPLLAARVAAAPQLRFRYNYQVFGPPGTDDHFDVLVGTTPPSAQSIGGYTTIYSTSYNHGGYTMLPGDHETLALDGKDVYACFRYGGDFDYYAQLDDVELRAANCLVDSDGDGIVDVQDNCLHAANADQRDTDADGIGNVCDADFDQSCAVNFGDLGIMKTHFFQTGTTDTDMDGDGQTNFVDLGLLKVGFFLPPGPSGVPNLCSTQ